MTWFTWNKDKPKSRVIVVIPCRLDSKRLPGKVLRRKNDKTMLQYVYEAASAAKSVDMVYIASHDEEIWNETKSFCNTLITTSGRHKNGTECVAEADYWLNPDDLVVNLQADEPEISPQAIDDLVACYEMQEDYVEVATLSTDLTAGELENRNTVKVVTCEEGLAHYFSRAPLAGASRHIGIYAFRQRDLLELATLPMSANESAEGLEQLRWLDSGYEIAVGRTEYHPKGIDTQADYDRWVSKEKQY